ncbi:hypothetical protein [Hyalangium versicolor]|uniref:hypothetical protein n=1 Tax=Hyalangium versicolor TaxID=2861190 RepID=UPI001CCCF0B6|nr:hypothetical protein [Hyalangium versicolor]
MSTLQLEVALEEDSMDFPAGSLLRGAVRVDASAPVHARSLECRVLWFTEGKGTEDVGGPEAAVLVRDQVLPPGKVLGFQLRLPMGPWSYGGQLVKIRWVVQLVLSTVSGEAVDVEVPFRLVPPTVRMPARATG